MDPGAQISVEDTIARLRVLPTPGRLLGLYDCAIRLSERGLAEPLAAVFAELMGAVDFDYGPVAEGFYRVYEYCLRKSREGDFRSVAWIVQDLRDACLDGRAAASRTLPTAGLLASEPR
jgi:hypothetical protein